jgi:hypothetical protein
MSAAYHGQRRAQAHRRDVLDGLLEELGPSAFSDFLIDILSEAGRLSCDDLPTLAVIWQRRQRAAIGEYFNGAA